MVTTRRKTPRSGISSRASAALRKTASSSRPKRGAASQDAVPDVYREMLAEAGAGPMLRRATEAVEPPLKKLKRPGQKSDAKKPATELEVNLPTLLQEEDEEDEDLEFEDVELPAPFIQTTELDSEDGEDEDEILFEDIDLTAPDADAGLEDKPRDLELNFTAYKATVTPRKAVDRRKPISKAERERRVEIHKMHLLCLLSHVARRNHWCNDAEVQEALEPLISDKMVTYLNPRANLSQFGRTESLKNGLQQVSSMFKMKFSITERGLRRALWAEEEEHLDSYQLPSDIESTLEKIDFREAAKTLQGSRDVGAQLFCALLRTAGVEARLVCSLQPLPFLAGAPTLAKPKTPKASNTTQIPQIYQTPQVEPSTSTATPSPRRRLGHPNAAAYHVPSTSTPTPAPSISKHQDAPRRIRNESPFPIYWVEVLDVAHQKWQPVDPLVTGTQWKPGKLEPPASDRENALAYAIAFEADGSARDVTRRYAKAYNSKTRRLRIDGLETTASADGTTHSSGHLSGEKWLRRALKLYRRPGPPADTDQIEATELAALEAREPMPRNVADFKDHPVYALERHLRRHEVLGPGASSVGTVGAGSKGPLERIYRRRDVRVARSADKWYRLGREVKPNEIPAKWLPKKQVRKKTLFGSRDDGDEDDDNDDDDDPVLGRSQDPGTPIFTLDQTELYVPPPVRNGRVPKNKFGNLDVFVPSMVPAGGAHVASERAAHAAFLLGVDYAPALTGWRFRGRHGTAVLQGAVVPAENAEAVRAVIDGLEGAEAEAEEERRRREVLRMWGGLLKRLRIRERILTAAEERGEELVESERMGDGENGGFVAEEEDGEGGFGDAKSDSTEEYDMYEDDEGGGGFLID